MPDRFPHLSNDAFPHMANVHPYRRKVPFDYGRYDYTASIKLCMVPWPSDYKHVINWQSASARDKWFADLQGMTLELPNGFTRVQTDTVRVNVPYDVVLTYNYVYMVVPPLTQDDPIHFEDAQGVRTICAWIQDAVYYAPSATELVLQVDYWTTYLPHLTTNTILMLHRGHAPAYATSADAFLADPKANCANLLTPDVSYGTSDVCAHSELVDIAQGPKMIVLSSTIPYSQIEGLATAQDVSGSSTPATFYDLSSRDGHQVGVSDYAWHYGGKSYAGMRNPTAYSRLGAAMPTYSYLYAIDSASASASFAALASGLPQFLASVQAAYILPRGALTLAATTLDVAGATLYRVTPTPDMKDLASLDLSKDMFGYPTRYADIAKLYTSPYAQLVVSDTLGSEIRVRIEDMGADARMVQQLSPMAECLRWDVLLRGINDAGADTYAWVNLDGTTRTMSLPGADVARYTLAMDIPTYALYLDGRIAHAMGAYYDAQAQRASAINGYQASMRSANTALANANDSADVAKANADASADVGKTNADASADVSVTNTANSGRNSQANARIQNNLRTTSTARNNQAQNALNTDAVQNIYDSSNADLEYTEYATDVNLKSEAVSSIQNMVSNAIAGNPMGMIGAGVSGIVNITTSGALANLSLTNVLDHQGISQTHTNTANSIHVANNTDQTTYSNTANTDTTDNNVNTANTNATNSANVSKANATRTQGVTKANATRTQGVTKANAGYGRDTAETNAKAALDLARTNYDRTGRAHDMDAPVAYGLASGDSTPDALMRRVLQVRIETQSKGAIARAGDQMLRYGYTYDGIWNVADWCPAGHDGCYWEASDLLINAADVDNVEAELAYETILLEGTTVWNDPAKIGGIPW